MKKGSHLSIESKNKIANKLKGRISPMFGKHQSEETKEKIRIKNTGRKVSDIERINNSISKLGEKSHFWKGGVSFGRYGLKWTKKLRSSIYQRDNYCCKICNNKNKKSLVIHHIDDIPNNCDDNNLIVLCRKCHSLIHSSYIYNKDYWISTLRELINSNNRL